MARGTTLTPKLARHNLSLGPRAWAGSPPPVVAAVRRLSSSPASAAHPRDSALISWLEKDFEFEFEKQAMRDQIVYASLHREGFMVG
ncbi:hypothetical protein CYMTET_26353 [Cymbomonas tetramitiformis]|uniref:Uncharacterized protein n=1 Tax=Cymbomonas tetramitiformis TaxID=36881 RepID=A0AAE0KYB4_9CHLO|nr:hypothetical protein CYMTET_26353 [Cymbomonas tetramitiformis]